jgi:hypothetical protein
LAVLTACKHDPSVVGKWTGEVQNNTLTFDLQADNTLTVSVKVANVAADITGTYTVDPKNLTLTLQKYKLNNVPEALKSVASSAMESVIKQPYKFAYHFNSEDELAVTYNGKTDVWKRVKDSE